MSLQLIKFMYCVYRKEITFSTLQLMLINNVNRKVKRIINFFIVSVFLFIFIL